ncbi:unnamed protein product [Adineta ricciae]|uniref:NAD(P)(+)--arginine ADP-ribosyltransferase n=1 Tax=Adineta ricciae TaxID=249248 RepID=A0A815URW3_ADIRI|nr:unnamed protein product [Adineta ricciae]
MGSGLSTESPSQSDDRNSAFYSACKNGDIIAVKEMLPNLTYDQVNQIEPNGSTALHAASANNHPHIVRLLLSSCCSRITVNNCGVTAYEEAATDEIKTLFHRTTPDRFVEENMTNSFTLLTSSDVDNGTENNIPDNWVRGHTSADSAHEAKFIIAMANTRNPLYNSIKADAEKKSTKSIHQLASQAVSSQPKDSSAVNKLLKNFTSRKGIRHLLTMYTLETPIYRKLQNEPDSLSILVYFHLSELRGRAFQGQLYRGAKMTQDDIKAYQWAIKNKDYVLETRTFQSTSIEESVAQSFAQIKCDDIDQQHPKLSVILTLVFPEKCPTAINLTKISDTLPLLSEFEDEKEVLILPFTLFSVKEMKIDSQTKQYRITLINVPTPKTSLSYAAKCIKT